MYLKELVIFTEDAHARCAIYVESTFYKLSVACQLCEFACETFETPLTQTDS